LFDVAWAGTGRFHWLHDAYGGDYKNKLRREIIKGNDGELGQLDPDMDTIIAFSRNKLSYNVQSHHKSYKFVKVKAAGPMQEGAEKVMASVKVEKCAKGPKRFYHHVTQAQLKKEDAPEATEGSKLDQMLQVHHWVPIRGGVGKHRQLLCACDPCLARDYDLCEESQKQFAFSAEHELVPETGSARQTRAEETVQLADDAGLAAETIKEGTCVSIEDNSPDAPLPFHLLKAASKPYTLDEDCASPILLHADGSPLQLSKGDRVFKAYFYQPIGKTGLRFEFWDQNWWNTGRFLPDFKAWEGCPAVIVPCTLMRHFGFHLTKEKVVRKSGPSFRLSQREYDSIEASLNLRLN